MSGFLRRSVNIPAAAASVCMVWCKCPLSIIHSARPMFPPGERNHTTIGTPAGRRLVAGPGGHVGVVEGGAEEQKFGAMWKGKPVYSVFCLLVLIDPKARLVIALLYVCVTVVRLVVHDCTFDCHLPLIFFALVRPRILPFYVRHFLSSTKYLQCNAVRS